MQNRPDSSSPKRRRMAAITASALAAAMGALWASVAGQAHAQVPGALGEITPTFRAAAEVSGGKGRGPAYRTDSVLVAFKDQAPREERLSALRRAGLAADFRSRSTVGASAYVVRGQIGNRAMATRDGIKQIIAKLRKEKSVRVVELDYILHASHVPNDPALGSLWGLHNTGQGGGTIDADIDAVEAWDITKGAATVKVAVIDTGVDYTHPDLAANILRDNTGDVIGYDFVNDDGDPMDDNSHGTHCAGTIGAVGNNGVGVVGVSHNVKIIPVKFLDADGYGTTSAAIDAIDFARGAGAQIMSNSWGGGGHSQLLLEAIKRARDAGILFVAAAGNWSSNNDAEPEYPASYNADAENVISVGASDRYDLPASFSNYGKDSVDLFAPGVDILSTTPGNTYSYFNGTSMATPHVAGAAALLKAKYAALDWRGLKARLLANVDAPSGLANLCQYGRLNVHRSLVVDTAAPGAPTLAKATRRTMNGLLVEWKASGDNGATGTAFQYEIRYSRTPITAANFDTLPLATGAPRPAASGTVQQALVMGLDPDAAYYVGVRAWDDAGNKSATAATALHRTLPPAAWLAYDDVNSNNWSSSGTSAWGMTSERYTSPSLSWADSPGANYTNNTDKYLTYAYPFDLRNHRAAVFSFKARTRLENAHDYLYVQASGDGGATWTTLGTPLTGYRDWQTYHCSLASFGGKSDVRIRFRMYTDHSVVDDGVWIDDIQVYHGGRVNALQDDVENTAGGFRRFSGTYPWAPSTEQYNTQTYSYTDSPYNWSDHNRNDALTQVTPTSLTGFIPELSFFTKYDLEYAWDFVHLETSTDGGATWKQRATFTGYAPGFWNYQASLMDSFGKDILMRFRITSDSTVSYDGIYIDDVVIGGQELVPVAAPSAPGNVQAAALSSTQVKITWADSLSETGYRVFRKTGVAGSYVKVAELGANVKFYTNAVPSADQTYYYKVTAFNAGDSSPDSAETSAKVMLAPTGLAAANGGGAGKVNLTWADKTGNETNYLVEYKTASATAYTVLPPLAAGATSKLVTGLTTGTSYNFRVRAQNASGYSTYTAVVTFTAP